MTRDGKESFKNEEEANGMTLNASNRSLTEFPISLIEKCQSLKFCYLEDNFLTELPPNIFQVLSKLQWLDLRRNNIEKLPDIGLANHQCLEVMLLQNNRIKVLPSELATIPHLKGLQIAGNPIENVPFEVFSAGFQSLMSFLRKQENCKPVLAVSETIIKAHHAKEEERTQKIEKSKQGRCGRATSKKKLQSFLENSLSVHGYNKCPSNLAARVDVKIRRNCPKNEGTCKTKASFPVTLEKIEESENDEVERTKLREILNRQSAMLQRIKDVNALKSWREKADREKIKLLDNWQVCPTKNLADQIPWGISRGLQTFTNGMEKSKHSESNDLQFKSGHPKSTLGELQSKINDINDALRVMDLQAAEDREKRKSYLMQRMNQISKLRRTLNNLHKKNII